MTDPRTLTEEAQSDWQFELVARRRRQKGAHAWVATVDGASMRACSVFQRWPRFYGATAEEALRDLRYWCDRAVAPRDEREVIAEVYVPPSPHQDTGA